MVKKALKVIGTIVGFIIVFIVLFILASQFLHIHGPARQSEVKTNLASITTAEIAFYAETNSWSGSFFQIGWWPVGKAKYVYFLTPTEHLGRLPEELGLRYPVDFGALGAPTPGYSENGFTAVAIGNVDSDATLDVWWIDQRKIPTNAVNDNNQ